MCFVLKTEALVQTCAVTRVQVFQGETLLLRVHPSTDGRVCGQNLGSIASGRFSPTVRAL